MNLLETNIYDVKGKVLICGTCLPRMQKDGFKKLEKGFDTILYLCLEKEHINMAITKICGMISTKKIESLTFASVNKSPHCIQLHYIKHEIERVMKDKDLADKLSDNGKKKALEKYSIENIVTQLLSHYREILR